jgi:hypothetical protein
MLKDDKVGIVWARYDPMDEFGHFDGKKFTFDDKAYDVEQEASSDAGANVDHMLAYGVWGAHPGGPVSQFQPFVLNPKTKRWTLRRRNDYYFPIMRKIASRNCASNKTTMLSVFDGCELRGIASRFSPWVVNDEGVSSFYEPAADEFTASFLQDCILELRGYDLIIDFNEPESQAFPDFFRRVVMPVVEETKWPLRRLTYGATTKPRIKPSIQDKVRAIVLKEWGRAADRTIIRADHGFPHKESLAALEPYNTDLYSVDGTYLPPGPGASPCDVRPGKGARPSPAALRRVALAILKAHPAAVAGRAPLVFLEYLPAGFSTGNIACWMAALRAFSAAYFATFGVWPSNYGKYPAK